MNEDDAKPPLPTAPVKLLNAQHPDYKAQTKHWSKIKLLFDGGNQLHLAVSEFLNRKPHEPDDQYRYRCERFYYENMMSAISWYGAKMFCGNPQVVVSQPPKDDEPGERIETGDVADFYNGLVSNCDRGGTTLQRFFVDVFLDALLYLTSWVVTDKNNIGDVALLSLKQYKEAGGDQPYWVRVDPQNVINWGTDNTGQLEYVVIKTNSIQQQFLEQPTDYTDWWYFDRTEFRHYQAKTEDTAKMDEERATAQLIDSGPHALTPQNRVPVQRLTMPSGLWLGDRAYSPCREHLNKVNELSFGLTMGCLLMPVYETKSEINQPIGEASHIKINPGDKFSFAEPKGEVFRIAMERIRDLREEIYRLVYLIHQGRDSRTTPTMQSGKAKQEDQAASAEILQAFGGLIGHLINNTIRDIIDARGENVTIDLKGFEFVVEISRDRLDKLLATLAADLGSQTLDQEIKIEIAMDVLPMATQQTRHKITTEIRSAPSQAQLAEQAEKDAEDARLAALAAGIDTPLPPGS